MNIHANVVLLLAITLKVHNVFAASISLNSETDSNAETVNKDDESQELAPAQNWRIQKENNIKRQYRDVSSSDSTNDAKRQCAIMYDGNKPLGIIQPFEDNYQLLPIHSDESIPLEISPFEEPFREKLVRDTDSQSTGESENKPAEDNEPISLFADEKYPYIFAKFKIDNKVSKSGKSYEKRDTSKSLQALTSKNNQKSLSSTLSKIEATGQDAESELRSILGEMGLIDSSRLGKRDADIIEDENLDYGTNKISLVKIQNVADRSKREEETINGVKGDKKSYQPIEYPEPKTYKIKDLENVNILEQPEVKKQGSLKEKDKQKRTDDVAELVEKQLKDRLNVIKKEVKEEIERLKTSDDDDKDNVNENENGEDTGLQRKKREVISTLVDVERHDLNPVLAEEGDLIPHIRRRRNVDIEQKKVQMEKVKTKDQNALILNLNPKTENTATEAIHFISRNLKKYEGDETNKENNYEIYDDINSDLSTNDDGAGYSDLENNSREKKACKCDEHDKNCKCRPKPLLGGDGSKYIYFDGAPELLENKVFDRMNAEAMESLKRQNKLSETKRKLAEQFRDGGYVLDVAPDIYKISIAEEKREKRNNEFDNLVSIHGGTAALNHLVAVRERSMFPKARHPLSTHETKAKEQRTLKDMTDEDLFGALPQSYEGELARHKRI